MPPDPSLDFAYCIIANTEELRIGRGFRAANMHLDVLRSSPVQERAGEFVAAVESTNPTVSVWWASDDINVSDNALFSTPATSVWLVA